MKGTIKLANFDDPKWTRADLRRYAKKYRDRLDCMLKVPENITLALKKYQLQSTKNLISNLKKVQAFLYR